MFIEFFLLTPLQGLAYEFNVTNGDAIGFLLTPFLGFHTNITIKELQ